VNINFKPKLSPKYGAQLFFLKYIKTGFSVLDVGCNRGEITYLLSAKAFHIDAYDISKKAIVYAKKYNSNYNITYFVADVNITTATIKKHYDVIILGSILSFVDNPKMFLNKLVNMCDIILIRETKFDNEILALVAEDLGIQKSKWREFTKSELTQLVITSGYRIIEDYDTYDMFIAATPVR
jgi:SAM-dependent methyltransferase